MHLLMVKPAFLPFHRPACSECIAHLIILCVALNAHPLSDPVLVKEHHNHSSAGKERSHACTARAVCLERRGQTIMFLLLQCCGIFWR